MRVTYDPSVNGSHLEFAKRDQEARMDGFPLSEGVFGFCDANLRFTQEGSRLQSLSLLDARGLLPIALFDALKKAGGLKKYVEVDYPLRVLYDAETDLARIVLSDESVVGSDLVPPKDYEAGPGQTVDFLFELEYDQNHRLAGILVHEASKHLMPETLQEAVRW